LNEMVVAPKKVGSPHKRNTPTKPFGRKLRGGGNDW